MNAELIVAAFLSHASITALVGSRKALAQLPQNSTFPALVYQVVTATPQPHLNYAGEPQMAQARIQINPLAATMGEVKAIHAAVRAQMDFKQQVTVAGKRVVSCRLDTCGPADKDIESGLWTQSTDYLLLYYE